MTTVAALQRRFQEVESQRRDLLDSLSALDEEALRRQPGEGQWSIVQILGHLTLAEEATLAYIRKKIQAPAAIPAAGLASWARFALLAAVLRSPVRRKAPERVAHPPADRSFADTRAEGDRVRAEWGAFIASFPPELVGRAVFRNPFVGRLSMRHTLGFMREHFRHHAKQIERRRRD